MSEQDLFINADTALKNVIGNITQGQWGMKIPDWFQRGRTQQDVTLREIINYHAYDEAWVPEVLAGKTIAEVGDTYDGDLVGDNPAESYARLYDKAVAAVSGLGDPDEKIHLTYGDWPAREYLQHISSFRGFRAYDIAKLIGADTALPAELVRGLWDMLKPNAEAWRSMGVFPPAVAVPEGSPLQDRLLGLSGRDPKA